MDVACTRQIISEKLATYFISVNKHDDRECIVSLVPKYQNWFVSFGFTYQNFVCNFLITHAFHILCPYFFVAQQPNSGNGSLLVEDSWSHTASHTHTHTHTLGLVCTRDQPVTQDATYTSHNKHKRRTSTSSAGFEPALPASERLQTYILDRMATGIGLCPYVGPILTATLILPTEFVI